MNQSIFWCLFTILSLFTWNVVFCGKSVLFPLNEKENHVNEYMNANNDNDFLLDTGKILKRDKRYLLWINGGISKVN